MTLFSEVEEFSADFIGFVFGEWVITIDTDGDVDLGELLRCSK